mmetsp:Transcript_62730/g.180462  ORF Transcript_62730/g.180462 Transcript_62730/m.180462 type:complete len:731 (-) Transcript_62730:271-2463(-)
MSPIEYAMAANASTFSTASSVAQGASPLSRSDASDCERVLESLKVVPSIRFGRFNCECGAFEDKYELREKSVLGTGMSGGVCIAISRSQGAQVAVKTLSTEGMDAEQRQQIRSEIENQLMLDHPNICRLLEVFEEPCQLRLVMERMQGPDLAGHLCRKGRYTERDAAGCVRQMAAAVGYCHRSGVCHRDLKLENFCLEDTSPDARVKLIDFGLSSVVASDVPLTTACGTLYYVAPEVLSHSYDQKCDMWSLGVITYILLDGNPPFRGRDDKATYLLIKKGRYDFPSNRWAHISSQAKDFVSSLLVVNVAKRLDAEAALAHPWLAEVAVGCDADCLEPLDMEVVESMRSFSKSNALKRAILRALAPVTTVERVAIWADHFETLDQDGDGKIAINDLARRLMEHGGLLQEEAADLSAALAEADDGGDLVSYSAFLSACLSASVTLDDQQLRSLFSRLDLNKSGTVSVEEVSSALGNVVDVEDLRREFGGGVLTYIDFRWLMSMPGHGPTILGLRQLLGVYGTLESSWKVSTRNARKRVTDSFAMEAARRENMAWREMSRKTQRGEFESEQGSTPVTPNSSRAVLSLRTLLVARGLCTMEEVGDLSDDEARSLVIEHLAEQGFDSKEELQEKDEDGLADLLGGLGRMSSQDTIPEEMCSPSPSTGPRRLVRTPTAVLVKCTDGGQDAWQCASVAAKGGNAEAVRRENMLWRKMHLSNARRGNFSRETSFDSDR